MDWERVQLFCVENLVWILIAITFIVFSLLNPAYYTVNSLISILQEAGMLGILALGLGLCLLTGSFDVSLGRIAGLSAVIVGLLSRHGSLPWFLILPIPLVIGLAIGIFYGILVGKGGQDPFLITLAGYIILRSLAHYVMGGRYFLTVGFDPRIRFLGEARIPTGEGVFVSCL